MSWRRELAKLGALFRRPKPVADLEEEIRSHLAMEEQENLEAGISAEEARHAARRRFGNVTLAQERSREMWRWDSVETLWQDLDCHLTIQPRISRAVDLSHAACAEGRQDFVGAESRAHRERHKGTSLVILLQCISQEIVADGNASRASVSVTSDAIAIVRRAIVR